MDDDNSVSSEEENGDEEKEANIASSSSSNSKKRKSNVDEEDEERKAERRAANRKSAFQSRLRKKNLIEDLQKAVAKCYKEGKELTDRNTELRSQLEAARLENELLKKELSKSTGSTEGEALPEKSGSLSNPQSLTPHTSTSSHAPLFHSSGASTGSGNPGIATAAADDRSGCTNPLESQGLQMNNAMSTTCDAATPNADVINVISSLLRQQLNSRATMPGQNSVEDSSNSNIGGQLQLLLQNPIALLQAAQKFTSQNNSNQPPPSNRS